ncbi:Branched-chain-amino-acid aminotransferase [Fusarium sp. LHS14.1]|nr:Branched-chain-amino-acid aminotransferase [Fusarium sp. LHS14.1]
MTVGRKSNGTNGVSPAPLNSKLLQTILVAPVDDAPVPDGDDPIRRSQKCTTSHMLVVNWTRDAGWAAPTIKPYRNFSVAPTSSVLHYGTECFEGLKLYRGFDMKLRLFRPDLNCARLRLSSLRGGLPDFDPDELLKLIEAFVHVDGERWLPEPGTFLYLRPAIIGTSAALGVSRPAEATLFLVAVLFPQFGQAGPGLKLLCSSGQVRAWPGGFGSAKLGANYAPSLVAQEEANAQGFIQVLWLFGPEDNVTEAGASNFFVIIRNKETGLPELITALLGDIILDGVTRRSVLELTRERLEKPSEGIQPLVAVERSFTMAEMVEASNAGRLLEAFVTGTAFFVAPVGMIRYRDTDIHIGNKTEEGDLVAPYTLMLRNWLKDIMYENEPHAWSPVQGKAV